MVDKEPRGVSRRKFLELLGLGGAGLVLGCTAKPAPAAGIVSPTPRPIEQTMPPLAPTPKVERPTEPTATPTEVPKPTLEATPLPRVISEETAQFVTWSAQRIQEETSVARKRGEVKIALPFDPKEGGELRFVWSPRLKQELSLIFLPPEKDITFYSFLEGKADVLTTSAGFAQGRQVKVLIVGIETDDLRLGFEIPNGQALVKRGSETKAGEPIFTARFVPGSAEQELQDVGTDVPGSAVTVSYKGSSGKYIGLRTENLLRDEEGRFVIAAPPAGIK